MKPRGIMTIKAFILILLSVFIFAPQAFSETQAPRNKKNKIWKKGVNSLANKGNAHYKRKEYPKAYEYYKKAEETVPEDARIKYNMGGTFYKLKNYKKAQEVFEESSKDKQISAKAFYNAGNAYYKDGKYEESAGNYKKAILLDPKDKNFKHNFQLALKQIRKKKNSCDKEKKQGKKKDKQKKKENKKKQDKNKMSKKQAEKLLKMMKEKEKSSIKPEMMKSRMSEQNKHKEQELEKDW